MANRIKAVIKGRSVPAAPPREVIAKAEQRLAEADKQRSRIKADPEREVAREKGRVKRAKRAKKEKPDA
jgi:hypothetical protein